MGGRGEERSLVSQNPVVVVRVVCSRAELEGSLVVVGCSAPAGESLVPQ